MNEHCFKLGLIALVAFPLIGSATTSGQGRFQNLDFELATIPTSTPPGIVSVGDAIPRWTAFGGQMVYNSVGLGGAVVILYGPGLGQSQLLQGNYSVGLRNSVSDPRPQASIAQTGQVPSSANSILYYAKNGTGIAVSFSGVRLNTFLLSSTPEYDIFGADIAGRGAQIGELRFTAISGGVIDDIQFSTQVVPEPSASTLLVGGLAVLAFVRHWPKARPR
jgi:hypothetical protein